MKKIYQVKSGGMLVGEQDDFKVYWYCDIQEYHVIYKGKFLIKGFGWKDVACYVSRGKRYSSWS